MTSVLEGTATRVSSPQLHGGPTQAPAPATGRRGPGPCAWPQRAVRGRNVFPLTQSLSICLQNSSSRAAGTLAPTAAVGRRGDRSSHRFGPGPKRTRVWVSTKISPIFPKTQRSPTPRIVDQNLQILITNRMTAPREMWLRAGHRGAPRLRTGMRHVPAQVPPASDTREGTPASDSYV